MIKYAPDNELSVFKTITGKLPSIEEGSDRIELVKSLVQSLDVDAALLSARGCSDVRGFSVFILGGILETIRDKEWFKEYGYTSFKAMVEEDIGLSRSTAYDYIKIYRHLTESGVSWDQIKHIGWTKIRWFARYLTKDNVDEWVEEAGDKNVEELKKYVKQKVNYAAAVAVQPKIDPAAMAGLSTQMDTPLSDGGGKDAVEDEDAKPPLITEASALDTAHIRHFKLYPEQELAVNQALDHVKEELQTENNGMALEGVCIAYLRDSVQGG